MKADPIRWTLGLAATEFGADRRTLSTRAKTSGQVPGEDGKFSTRQIDAIIHGDLAGEKLRKLRAEADMAERANREAEGATIAVERVCVIGERFVAAARQIILHSSMSDAEKSDVLNEMVQLGEVDWTEEAKTASKQTR